MSVEWSYAQLSKMASNVGGPEKLIQIIRNHAIQGGVKSGRVQMLPFIGIAFGLGFLGAIGLTKWQEYRASKLCEHPVSVEEAAMAEEILIQNMVDAEGQEPSDRDSGESEDG